MKIVIIGGSGLIGTKLGMRLRERGHETVSASPSSGVNTLTGEGLAEALKRADVVVDVSNSPSFEDKAVMSFFDTSTRNVLRAAADAGVRHYVALSVVGAERLPDSGYMRAKVAQEALIKAGTVPYTIARATQFYEFAGAIAGSGDDGRGTIRLPSAKMQPMAADDVAALLADVVVAKPLRGTVEFAGPDVIPMDELARRFLSKSKNPRPVVADASAKYYGAVNDRSLTPGDNPRLGAKRFEDWVSRL